MESLHLSASWLGLGTESQVRAADWVEAHSNNNSNRLPLLDVIQTASESMHGLKRLSIAKFPFR